MRDANIKPMAEPRDQDGEMEHHISRKVVELQCHLNGREVVQDGQEERREAKGNEDGTDDRDGTVCRDQHIPEDQPQHRPRAPKDQRGDQIRQCRHGIFVKLQRRSVARSGNVEANEDGEDAHKEEACEADGREGLLEIQGRRQDSPASLAFEVIHPEPLQCLERNGKQ